MNEDDYRDYSINCCQNCKYSEEEYVCWDEESDPVFDHYNCTIPAKERMEIDGSCTCFVRKYDGMGKEIDYSKKRLVDIIKDWKRDCGIDFREPMAIHVEGNKLYIITDRPGCMIGFHGKYGFIYRRVLKEAGYDYEVQFVDTFFANVKEF